MASDRSAPVSLYRFFVKPDALQANRITFSTEQAHQIRNVLRLRPGHQVIAVGGDGVEYSIRLELVGDIVSGPVEQAEANNREPLTRLTLYLALLKRSKYETVLQKGTEIGVTRFATFSAERSIAALSHSAQEKRFTAIVREAAEQSGRGIIPDVQAATSFREALESAAREGRVVLLWEEEKERHLRDVPLRGSNASLSLFVGPEGGFSEEEAGFARRLGGDVVTLGPRVLRSETAAIAGCCLILQARGDLG